MEVDPKSFNGYQLLGDAALEDGQYLEAILQYEHALALRHRMVENQLARARRGARQEP